MSWSVFLNQSLTDDPQKEVLIYLRLYSRLLTELDLLMMVSGDHVFVKGPIMNIPICYWHRDWQGVLPSKIEKIFQ